MRLNKMIIGVSALTMAIMASMGMFSDASAEETVAVPEIAKHISIDYKNKSLTVNNTSNSIDAAKKDRKVFVSFPTVKAKKIKGQKNICSYDAVDSNGAKKDVEVDLSALKSTKDNYVKVWGDVNETPIIIKIPAAVSLGKAKIDYGTNKLTVFKKDKSEYKGLVDYSIGDCYYAGSFDEADNPLKLEDHMNLGTTIRLRAAAVENIGENITYTAENKSTVTPVQYDINKSTDKAVVYELDSTFTGNEIKVKVAKTPAAPKVGVNYTSGTVKLPNNSEFRVNDYEDEKYKAGVLGKWIDGSKKVLKSRGDLKDSSNGDIKKINLADGKVLDFVTGGVIDVRTKGSAKKPASNYLVFNYDKKDSIYVEGVSEAFDDKNDKAEDAKYNAATAKLTDKQVSSSATIPTENYLGLEISYERTPAKSKIATSGAITIKNNSEKYAFQYISSIEDNPSVPNADLQKGVSTVKARGKATIKFKNTSARTFFVRRAAISKGEVKWATDWVKVMSFTKTQLIPTAVNDAKSGN